MKQLMLMMAGLAATVVCACSAHSQDPPRDDSDKYIVKDGWRVRGYVGSTCIADTWYEKEKDADDAVERMRGYTETKGKFYDDVKKDPESQTFYVGRPSGYDPRPKDTDTSPSRSQSGSAGVVPSGVIPAPGATKSEVRGETIFDMIKPPLKNWYQNRGKGGTPPESVEPQRLEMIERFKGFDGPIAPPPPPIEFPPGYTPKEVNPLKMNAPAPPTVLPPLKGTPYNPPPLTSRSRGYGYDESAVKELAPKGVTMRVGINGGTLQRAEAPPALLDAIRGVK